MRKLKCDFCEAVRETDVDFNFTGIDLCVIVKINPDIVKREGKYEFYRRKEK